MKLHFYTQESSPFAFESRVFIMDDEDFFLECREKNMSDILNCDDVRDSLYDNDWDSLRDVIDSLFDYAISGQFNWEDKTGDYYDHYARMFHYLHCNLENESGDTLKTYSCIFEEWFNFGEDTISMHLTNFYSGNGEPEGAQLALNIVGKFMKDNQWHVGFYDHDANLITDIRSWAKTNIMTQGTIKPIIWFGLDKLPVPCWSITPETDDKFIDGFWGDYYEGALVHIFHADEGLGIYYSVWEYGLECYEEVFDKVKKECPIDLSLSHADRNKALFSLIEAEYTAIQ